MAVFLCFATFLLTFGLMLKLKIDFKAVFLPVDANWSFLSGHKSDNLLAPVLIICYHPDSLNLGIKV